MYTAGWGKSAVNIEQADRVLDRSVLEGRVNTGGFSHGAGDEGKGYYQSFGCKEN